MNLLFVGSGQGSWEIRGNQIGHALGARVTSAPTIVDWRWASLAIIVKRAIDEWGPKAQRVGVPVIWDALDFWDQPDANPCALETHVAAVQRRRRAFDLFGVIGATHAMARDIDGIYLPHHGRPGLELRPPRREPRIVAYEGTPKYLGSWRRRLEEACARRGVLFVVNPVSLADADVVVALRAERWDGEVCRQWKSGVKYVNALVAGKPVLTQRSAGFDEIQPFGRVIGGPEDLDAALDHLLTAETRHQAFDLARRHAIDYALSTMTRQYRDAIDECIQRAA